MVSAAEATSFSTWPNSGVTLPDKIKSGLISPATRMSCIIIRQRSNVKSRRAFYHIFFSEEDGGYIADIPDLAHCSAFGESPEEALAQALIAKKVWLEAAKKESKAIPKPKYRPAIDQLAAFAN